MTVIRIPMSVASEVNRLRLLGRTDRQIETFCNLPAHSLDRAYLIDDSEEREAARIHRERGIWRARHEARFVRLRSLRTPERVPEDSPSRPEGQPANDTTSTQPKRTA